MYVCGFLQSLQDKTTSFIILSWKQKGKKETITIKQRNEKNFARQGSHKTNFNSHCYENLMFHTVASSIEGSILIVP